MKRVIACALVVLLPVAGVAQKDTPAKPCVFDTSAHTDTLTLEFSLRAFRGDDTLPDTLLTRGFGAMIASHFVAPPSIGQLLYPNTYYRRFPYTATGGTLQFTLQPDGTMRNLKWFAPSMDPATDAAIEQALHAATAANEPRDLAALVARKKVDVRVRFAATSATTLHAALLRLRVPMMPVDSLPHMLPGSPHGMAPREAFSARTMFEAIIDQAGVVERDGVQIVEVSDQSAGAYFLTNLINTRWAPATIGGCPVAFRLAYRISANLIKR